MSKDAGNKQDGELTNPSFHSRFKPGQSGNPKGFRRGSPKSVDILAAKAGGERIRVKGPNGEWTTLSAVETAVHQLVNAAIKGEKKAVREVIDFVLRKEEEPENHCIVIENALPDLDEREEILKTIKRNTQDQEVGYKKPPRASQFQKGKSGNPKGRPRKRRDFEGILARILQELVGVNKKSRSTKFEIIIRGIYLRAAKSDPAARKEVKRLEARRKPATGSGKTTFILEIPTFYLDDTPGAAEAWRANPQYITIRR